MKPPIMTQEDAAAAAVQDSRAEITNLTEQLVLLKRRLAEYESMIQIVGEVSIRCSRCHPDHAETTTAHISTIAVESDPQDAAFLVATQSIGWNPDLLICPKCNKENHETNNAL